jgi:succinylglutamate desuccinylase
VNAQAVAADLAGLPRELGLWPRAGEARGTLLFVVGGLHGNEPAGVHAIRTVFAELERRALPLAGRVVGLVGNRAAVARGRRYAEADLNRLWTEEHVAAVRRGELASAEAREQAELLAHLDLHLAAGFERVVLLDLHSTSAGGAPFTIHSDTLQNRPIAFALPVPVLLGLEERVEGTLLSWFADQGHAAVCLEGGQNDVPSTVENHVAALWLTLASTGLLAEHDLPELARHRARLANSARNLPAVVELRYRYGIDAGATFEMLPGFQNFQPVRRGEVLARIDAGGGAADVASPLAGRMLMPRYQALGDDGFFLGREVRPFWLGLSGLVRRARLDWVVRTLPGVAADRARPGELSVDRRIARWFTVEILHLFGYRWRAREGRRVRFVRRRDSA